MTTNKLTQEEKRIKIEAAQGRVWTQAEDGFWDCNVDDRGINLQNLLSIIPDYFGDLNAMHEAEKVFTNAQWQAFLNRLEAVTGAKEHGTWWECIQCAVHAAAAQRAEAFGLTLGLWEDGQ